MKILGKENSTVQTKEKSGRLWVKFRSIVNFIAAVECFATARGCIVHSPTHIDMGW